MVRESWTVRQTFLCSLILATNWSQHHKLLQPSVARFQNQSYSEYPQLKSNLWVSKLMTFCSPSCKISSSLELQDFQFPFLVLSLKWNLHRVVPVLTHVSPLILFKIGIMIQKLDIFYLLSWRKKRAGSLVGSLWKPLMHIYKLAPCSIGCQFILLFKTWNASTRQNFSQ